MLRQPINDDFNGDLSYVNYSNGVSNAPMSRRGSRDMTQDVQRLRNEGIRGQLLREIEVITIPAGTRLNLWDGKHITDAHFVSPVDLNVLVRRGHGSMYKLLQQIAYPEDVPNRLDSNDLNQLWGETKEAFKSIPLVRNLVTSEGRFNDAISMVISQLQERDRIDAILMAYTYDGKVGLHFINRGNHFNTAFFSE